MLRVEQLEVRRGQGVVLSGIDLQLHPGEVLGVLGPNGAGKSTLLAALSGELPASAGQVTLDQRALYDWAGPERARRLAVLPQSSSLNFAFRVEEVVAMGRLPHDSGRVRDAQIVQQALLAADAVHLAGRSYLALSGGERQRVHLARVLAQLWPGGEGQILLLDEPLSALDLKLRQHMRAELRSLQKRTGVTFIYITHDQSEALAMSDRVAVFHQGEIQQIAPPRE